MSTQPRPRRWIRALLLFLALLGIVAAAVPLAFAGRARRFVGEAAQEQLAKRFPFVRVGDELSYAWPAQVTIGPVDLGLSEEQPPVVHVDLVRVRLRGSRLLRGHVEPGAIGLKGVRIEAGEDGRDLVKLLETVRAEGTSQLREGTYKVTFEDVRAAASHGARIEWGPINGRGKVIRDANGKQIVFDADAPDGASIHVQSPALAGMGLALLSIKNLPAPLFSPLELPLRIEGGRVFGDVALEATGAMVKLDVRDFVFSREGFARGPIGPMRMRLDGPLVWDLAERRLYTGRMDVRLGDVDDAPVAVKGDVLFDDVPRFSLSVAVKGVSYAKLVKGLPEALAPGPGAEGVDGPLDASLSFVGAAGMRESWDLVPTLDLTAMRKAAREKRFRLRDPFDVQVLTSEGRGRTVAIGPKNPHFVPYEKIPRALVRSVLLSEDASFFVHSGFDFESLERNLLAERVEGEVVRGGSSVSQQLAKNLFLTRQKTYARKVREAFLTVALEAAVPKERLLEIYFNFIEWGPDIYGLGEAARHYFDKPAADLSVKEAAFLATIIPSPVKFHMYCVRGAVTEGWNARINVVLDKLHALGDLDDAAYEAAKAAPLVFRHR
jgi:hypothetical protein